MRTRARRGWSEISSPMNGKEKKKQKSRLLEKRGGNLSQHNTLEGAIRIVRRKRRQEGRLASVMGLESKKKKGVDGESYGTKRRTLTRSGGEQSLRNRAGGQVKAWGGRVYRKRKARGETSRLRGGGEGVVSEKNPVWRARVSYRRAEDHQKGKKRVEKARVWSEVLF